MKKDMKAIENIIGMLDRLHYAKSATKHKYGHWKEEEKKGCEKCGKEPCACECEDEEKKESKKEEKSEAKTEVKEAPKSLKDLFGK